MDVRLPDGRIIQGVPEGTTRAQLAARLRGNGIDVPAAWMGPSEPPPIIGGVDPTSDMGTGQRLLAATGLGMTKAARGVGQLLGLVSDGEVADAARTDAPLLATGAGKVGNVIGAGTVALPTALIPGANTVAGASAVGAALGGLTTEGDARERLVGAASGGVGGALGTLVGKGLAAGGKALADRSRAAYADAFSPRMQVARQAADAGLVVPPADLQPGVVTRALSGLGGKIKGAQDASHANLPVINDMVRRDLGLPAGTPLTPQTLQAVRAQAAQSGYEPVRRAGVMMADPTFDARMANLGAANKGVMPDFPDLARSDVGELLNGMRRPQQFDAGVAVDAVRMLRAKADQAFRSGDSEMGRAANGAAKELEALIERNLAAKNQTQAALASAAGKPAPGQTLADPGQTLADFQAARRQMARSFTAEKAANPATGDINAKILAAELRKGKPLTGGMRTAAEFAATFPHAAQPVTQATHAWSPLDWAIGALGGAGSGSPIGLLAAAARPAVRAGLLSGPVQRRAMAEPTAPVIAPLLQRAAEAQLLQRAIPGLLAIDTAQAAR